MGIYTTGSVHFSGLGSDLDVDTLIEDLYKVESRYAKQLIEWSNDWQTRLTAFQEIRAKLLDVQSTLKSINSVSKFLAKSATSSNTSVAAVTANGDTADGVYNLSVNQLAQGSIWSTDTGVASKTDVINNSGMDGSFTYTYKGESRTLVVPNGTTLEGLRNLINNDSTNPGVKVQLIDGSDGLVFQFKGMGTGVESTLSIDSVTNIDCLQINNVDTWTAAGTNVLSSNTRYADAMAVVNSTGGPKTFTFNVNGTDTTVKLKSGGTLWDLAESINETTGTSGVTAHVMQYTSGSGEITYGLRMSTANASDTITVGQGTLEGYSGMTKPDNWVVQAGKNAEVRIDGWPATGWLERSSNTIDDVAEGLTFNIRSEGDTVVAVETDTAAIEANVQSFVDAVNEFRTLVQYYTTVDKEKTLVDPDKAKSQFEMQMGGVLTGNYGIQILSSNFKSIIASQGLGFSYLEKIGTEEFGDVFSSLSQIGITTDANVSSETYGLLIIKDVVGEGSWTLAEALEKDPLGVAKLFASDSEGSSKSPHFGYNSHVVSVTKPGTYDVEYSVDEHGKISEAFINGKKANIDQDTRQISIYSHTGAANEADGIVLDIYDLTPNKTFEGKVSITQGKVNQVLGAMSGADGWLGENGVLKNLESNYKSIIENIEEKILKEDARLEKWESSMRNKFARLEAVLTKYNKINEDLETQIKQLSSSK